MKASRLAFLGSVGWVLAAWLAVYLVDVQNLFGLRTLRMTADGPKGIWPAIFTTHGPTELLQWFALLGVALVSAHLAGRMRSGFWLFMACTLTLVLIEDTLDTCNQVARILPFAPDMAELAAYLLDASVIFACASWAVLRYGLGEWRRASVLARILLVSGLTVYAVVAAFHILPQSATGQFVNDIVAAGDLNGRSYYLATVGELGFYNVIADTLLEEAFELIAAGLLLTGALVRWEQCKA